MQVFFVWEWGTEKCCYGHKANLTRGHLSLDRGKNDWSAAGNLYSPVFFEQNSIRRAPLR